MLVKLILFLITASFWCVGYGQELPAIQTQGLPTENILSNPGFESGKYAWTIANGTSTTETSVVIKGKNALKVVLVNQTLSTIQDSNKYAAQFADGVQLLAYARVKTSVSGVKLCPRKAGVTQTSLCVSHTGSGKWELLKVPFISSATSNGLIIQTDANVSGTVYVDDSFLGAQDVKQDTSNVSNWVDGVCSGSWSNTTYTCKYMRVGDTMKLQVKATVTGAVSGGLSINIPTGFSIDVSKLVNTSIQLPMGTGSLWDTSASQDYALYPLYQNSTQLFVAYSTNVNTGVASLSSSAPIAISTGDIVTTMVDIPILGWSSSGSIYSSTNADTDWQSYTPTGTWTTNTTYSGQWKRRGNMMDIQARISLTGAPNAGNPTISLPLGYVIDTSKFPNGTAVTYQSPVFGTANALDSGNGIHLNVAYNGTTSVIFLYQNSLSAANTLVSNTTPFSWGAGDSLEVNFSVPIQGWENSNVIIGQFNGLESCKDSYECIDTFSASISSSGTILSQNIPWISGSCSVASAVFTCGLNSGLAGNGNNLVNPMHCVVNPIQSTSDLSAHMRTSTTTNLSYVTSIASSGASDPRPVNIICQKQGADYIAKSAKAVASDQNIRSIGAVGVDIQSVYFGSGASCLNPCNTIGSCTVCTRVGSKITSVEAINTTGFYRLNGIDGTKYICNGQGLGSSSSGVITHELGSSTSTYAGVQAWNAGSGAAQGRASVTCIGVP